MAAEVISLKIAQRLERLYSDGLKAQQQAASIVGQYNEARAATLEMLGLDPENDYGIDFKTGMIRPPPSMIRPAPPEDAPEAAPPEAPTTEQPA